MAYKDQIANIIPARIPAERLIVVFSTVVSRNQDLKVCSPASLVGCLMQASILNLNIEPALGHCFMIPRENKYTHTKEANFQIGYKGYISLMYRIPRVVSVWADVIRENDLWDYSRGSGAPPVHKYPKIGSDRGPLVGAYCSVQIAPPIDHPSLKPTFIVNEMWAEDILKHKKFSQAAHSDKSPWNFRMNKDSDEGDWEEKMWIKTAVIGVTPMLPFSSTIVTAVASDDHVLRPEMFQAGTGIRTELLDESYDEKAQAAITGSGPVPRAARAEEATEIPPSSPTAEPPSAPHADDPASEDPATSSPGEKPSAVPTGTTQAAPAPGEAGQTEILLGEMNPETFADLYFRKCGEVMEVLKLPDRESLRQKCLKFGFDMNEAVPKNRQKFIIGILESLIAQYREREAEKKKQAHV